MSKFADFFSRKIGNGAHPFVRPAASVPAHFLKVPKVGLLHSARLENCLLQVCLDDCTQRTP